MKRLTATLLAATLGATLALPAAAHAAPRMSPPPAPAAQHAPQPQRAPAVQRAAKPHAAPTAQRAPQRQWRTGERLPSDYRQRQHVVHDWRAHRLPQPARGHQWVQLGGSFAHVALSTGLITLIVNA